MAAGPQLSRRVAGDGSGQTERSTSPPTGATQRHQGTDGPHQCPRQSGQRQTDKKKAQLHDFINKRNKVL